MDELIGAELIGIVLMTGVTVFRLDAFPEVRAPGTFLGRANSVAPIITVGEASAGKPDHRCLDPAHLIDQVFANSIDIGNGRVLSYPNAVVNHPAQIFGEMPIDIGRDHSQGFVEEDFDS